MLSAAITILAKDLRLRVRDRSVLMLAVVVPFGLTWLFWIVLPDTEELVLQAAVLDQDGGQAAAAFVEEVVPALVEQGLLDPTEVDGEEAARDAMDAGELDAVWVLPEGFSAAVTTGEASAIDVWVNPDRPLRTEVARAIADQYGAELERVSLAVATASAVAPQGLDEGQVQQVVAAVTEGESSLELTDRPARDHQLDLPSSLSSGLAAFFVFFTVQFGVLGLLEERQFGTLNRLLASPLTVLSIHLGKALGAFLLGIVSMTVLAVASALLMGASWGPPGGVALLIVAIVVAALGLMALVGSFARTAEQAGNYQAIVAVVLGMVSGAFFPLPLDEGVMRIIGWISPHAWFLRGLGDATGHETWTAALPAVAALVTFGAVTAGLAALRIRRMAAP
jgi:ABC-2 type transport system permease protein